MKPLKLVISGWGPYRDTQTVDFTPLKQGGLCLITGPTGAGKTTIFDAITFALYGEVSGSVREKDSLRSDFAAPETATWVELSFLHQGILYRIVRNPRYERPKLRGEGTTAESEGAELYREEVLEVSGSQQVTEAVKAKIGLDYRQYKQISMIAQGEFLQLLTASSRERTLIFRDLFQTGLYDRVSQLLAQQVKQLHARLEEQKNRMDEILSMVQLEDEAWREQKEKKNKNYARLTALIQADQIKCEAEVIRLKTEGQENGRKYRAYAERLGRIRQENQIIERYLSDKKRLDELNREVEALMESHSRLEEDVTAVPRLKEEAEQLAGRLDELNVQCDRISEWERQNAHLRNLQQEYIEVDAEAQKKKQAYESQEDLYRKAAAGLLAQKLESGCPCPVCGSLVHPSPAVVSGRIPNERVIQKLKKEAEDWMGRAAGAQADAAAAYKILTRMTEAFGEMRASVEENVQLVRERLSGEIRQCKADMDAKRKRAAALEREFQESLLLMEKKRAAWQQAKESLKKPEQMEKQQETELEETIRDLEAGSAGKQDLQAKLETRISIGRRVLEQLKGHTKEKERLEQVYGYVRKLERAATGNNAKKLVLEQYVLSIYFDDILRAANLRLRVMTGERYELYRMEEGRDRRMKEGMELEVLDQYTGKRRSAKSLSGGESFHASLALALGMSDVVQSYAGGIQVETLFVDEGFGGLDGESLSQAVDILISLSTGQRLIGIISHVEELKEQIDSQITVEKTNNGSSIKTNFEL